MLADNMSIVGLTIDYGPFGELHVFGQRLPAISREFFPSSWFPAASCVPFFGVFLVVLMICICRLHGCL